MQKYIQKLMYEKKNEMNDEKGTKLWNMRVTSNSIVPKSYKYSLVPLHWLLFHKVNDRRIEFVL
jgi:hypothetical protein